MRFNVEQLAEWWQKWLCDSSAFTIHVRLFALTMKSLRTVFFVPFYTKTNYKHTIKRKFRYTFIKILVHCQTHRLAHNCLYCCSFMRPWRLERMWRAAYASIQNQKQLSITHVRKHTRAFISLSPHSEPRCLSRCVHLHIRFDDKFVHLEVIHEHTHKKTVASIWRRYRSHAKWILEFRVHSYIMTRLKIEMWPLYAFVIQTTSILRSISPMSCQSPITNCQYTR